MGFSQNRNFPLCGLDSDGIMFQICEWDAIILFKSLGDIWNLVWVSLGCNTKTYILHFWIVIGVSWPGLKLGPHEVRRYVKQAGKHRVCIWIPLLVWWHIYVERDHWLNSHWKLLHNMFVVIEWCLLSMYAIVVFTWLYCLGFTINIQCQNTYFRFFFLLLQLCNCCRQFVCILFYVML